MLSQVVEGEHDFAQFFVHNATELREPAPQIIQAVKFDGLMWFSYPKRRSKVKTDIARSRLGAGPGSGTEDSKPDLHW